MTKAKFTAPLGSGSYDYDDLKEATDAVAKGTATGMDRDVAMNEAVRGVDTSKRHEIDRRDTPGYSWRNRRGSTGKTERIQVADGETEEAEAKPGRHRAKAGASSSSTSSAGKESTGDASGEGAAASAAS